MHTGHGQWPGWLAGSAGTALFFFFFFLKIRTDLYLHNLLDRPSLLPTARMDAQSKTWMLLLARLAPIVSVPTEAS